MKFSDQSHNLRIELVTENYTCPPAQIEYLERTLDLLRESVRNFPVSDLYIDIKFHPRSHDFRIKTALVLTGRTLATGDLDPNLEPAFERCVRKLVKRAEEYKADLGREPERHKHLVGTHQSVVPGQEPNGEVLEAAVRDGDYAAFREATFDYEEPIRKRVGRWIDRYPQVEAEIGDELKISDIVEEVFLNAFERYDSRPQQVRFGEWLDQLIDPSIKLLMRAPDEEMQNISFAQTLTGEG